MTHHNTRQTTRTFTATFRRFQQHTASTTKAFVFGHVVLVFLFQHFSHRFGIASRASGFPRRIIPRWILVVSEHQNKKNKNKANKYNTVSHRTFFFCSVLYNTTLPSYRLPQLWCAIHVVPGQQRGNAKRTATTSTGCFLLNFSNGSCWQRGEEREPSSASSATKTQTRRIKNQKKRKPIHLRAIHSTVGASSTVKR